MKRISRDYVDFLESVVRSLLAERERNGQGDFDRFPRLNLDLGPTDEPAFYTPFNIKGLMVKTYKEFVEAGWK